ncbi:PAS domain-containing sensor histidine kinase [Chitinophaga arvensicola]|uniref:histidine kinase n=1 Tax=Chitinophaga arvensicola TaxID=29529 RepID=A0A1I0SAA8_9BACT|nr:PAS domain-containing protein [Chitinophaga arvensicola]SEW53313.1 PAS domain S-box-containing protein [Chitinophaga arvensicola]
MLEYTKPDLPSGSSSSANGLLTDSEQRFRNMLLQSPAGFAILSGQDMVVEFVNQAMLRLWKGDADIVGKPLLELMPEMGGQSFPTLIQTVYRTGQPHHSYEEKVTLQNSETDAYYDYVYQPLFAADGTVTGVSVMATDVTVQVEDRKKVKESEARFRALVMATTEMRYRMSPDWKEMWELQGMGFLKDVKSPISHWDAHYVPEEEKPRLWAAIQTAIASKTIFEMEHRVLRADGSPGWAFSRAVPILGSSGEIVEWFGAARDITIRKQMDEALQQAKEDLEGYKRLYETITNNTPDLIYVLDVNYRFTYANEALLTMWGKTWEQGIGKSLLENGYEPWHAEMHEREIDQVVATRKSVRGEVSFPHAVLGKRIYDYIFVPVVNEEGDVEAVAGTTRDITEIRLAEEALRRSREELEVLVEDRTRALHRSNEDLRQFAHVSSHDMKEPVRKIVLFAGLLTDECGHQLDTKSARYLAKISDSAKRIYSMIEGILSFSSFQEVDLEVGQVDLNSILKEVESDFEVVIREKQASIEYTDLPLIAGFPLLTSQLFSNLISNALKFSTPERDPVIRISAAPVLVEELLKEKLDERRHYVKIVVSDNGIGFNEQYADKIFQIFSRLNSKDQFEGTGLGLALCRKISERHGGTIWANGKEKEGATFSIILPTPDPA